MSLSGLDWASFLYCIIVLIRLNYSVAAERFYFLH